MPPYPGFVGASYVSQSSAIANELCVNWYPERIESEGARVKSALYPTPGVVARQATALVGGRGVFAQSNRAFGVIGNGLVEIFEDWSYITRGPVGYSTSPAIFTTSGDSGQQLLVGVNNAAYMLDLVTNVVTNVVAGAAFVGFLDGFFIRFDPTTSTIAVSESLDGTTWDSTQLQQRSDASDPWRSMLIIEPEMWMFGEATSGVWYNRGTAPFPLAPRQGLVIHQGIAAPYSAKALDGAPTWLGTNPGGGYSVYQAQGYTPVRVSTEAIETAMGLYSRVDDAEAYVYTEDGHPFYVLNFPAARATWALSGKLGTWHQRGTWNAAQNLYDASHAQSHAFAWGKHIVLERDTGTIYQSSIRYGSDAGGAPLRRVRQGPGLRSAQNRIFIHNFQLDIEQGLGLPIGQGSDPQVMFQASWDGGRTWGYERWASAGREGDYGARVLWPGIGSGAHFVPRVVVTDPFPSRIAGAEFNVPTWEPA